MKKQVVFLLTALSTMLSMAQSPAPETAIVSVKRVHRIVDVRQQQNKELAWPGMHFGKLFWDAAMNGKLEVYLNDQDSFLTIPADTETIIDIVSPLHEVQMPRRAKKDPDFDPLDLIDTILRTPFDPVKDIVKYELVEDWFYTQNPGTVYVNIIAIAPLCDRLVGGLTLSNQPICWAKFYVPDSLRNPGSYSCLQELNAGHKVFDRLRPDSMISLDLYFQEGRYSGFVIRENDISAQYFSSGKIIQPVRNPQPIMEILIKSEQDLWGN